MSSARISIWLINANFDIVEICGYFINYDPNAPHWSKYTMFSNNYCFCNCLFLNIKLISVKGSNFYPVTLHIFCHQKSRYATENTGSHETKVI